MKVCVPIETRSGERRVALVPDFVKRLSGAGFECLVEKGAGSSAGFSDEEYEASGAQLVGPDAIYTHSDLILKVQAPTGAELNQFHSGQVLISFLDPLGKPQRCQALAERGITAFSMELIPRITRAQSMDALSAMSSIAGYKAVLYAADALPKFFPMLVTAAGTLPPAKVFVIGAGVAGLQAIASARRIGGVVSAFDIRPVVKEQVESLGAKFVEVEMQQSDTQDAGGYAKSLNEEAKARVAALLHETIPQMDVVITTALIPGKPAPCLIQGETVRCMKSGSVIVDLAAESGGNCELTRPGETIVEQGVTILGPLNIPSTMPLHASQMYSKNVATLLQHLAPNASLELNMEDEIIRASCVAHAGETIHPHIRKLLDVEQAVGKDK